jgi:uncharacterized membrane protein
LQPRPVVGIRFRPVAALLRLRSTYWFLPSLVTAGAAAFAAGLIAIDTHFPAEAGWLDWSYGGGADGARAVLVAVAGSTMTVVSVTFSVMVVALTVSSQHFGPRLLSSFMRDSSAQLMLGTFTGTFVYCLVVLRTVHGDGGDQYVRFVPSVAITGALALALVSVGVLIYYVHHIAQAMQVSEITASVARELERTVDRMYPERIGHGTTAEAAAMPQATGEAVPVPAARSGYVREIDTSRLVAVASRGDLVVRVLARPGTFVIEGRRLASIYPAGAAAHAAARRLSEAFAIGNERSPQQDVAFGIQQLVEVVLRGLSPGVNEPFTAMTALDRLGQALTRLAVRARPSGIRADDAGRVRVLAQPYAFADLLRLAFDVHAFGVEPSPAVRAHLREVLVRVEEACARPDDRIAVRELITTLDGAPDAAVRIP